MRTYFWTTLMVVFSFFACQDDDNQKILYSEWGNCLGQEEPRISPSAHTCKFPGLSNRTFCDTIFNEEVIPIPNKVKEWMPYYCLDVGDRIYFWNGRDKVDYGIVESKDYFVSRSTSIIRDSCDNPNDQLLYCDLDESAWVNVYFRPIGKNIAVYLFGPSNSLFYQNTGRSVAGVFLGSGGTSDYHGTMSIGSEGDVILGETIDDFSYNGIRYGEVIEFENYSVERNEISFFYSKDHGIVSFIDESGEQWYYMQ